MLKNMELSQLSIHPNPRTTTKSKFSSTMDAMFIATNQTYISIVTFQASNEVIVAKLPHCPQEREAGGSLVLNTVPQLTVKR